MQPDLWDAVLRGICETVSVSKAALISHELEANNHRILATFGDATRESIVSYEKHYYKFDEWTARFANRIPIGRFAHGEEVWPKDLMFKSVFFNEFLKPFDTCQMVCLAIGKHSTFDGLSIYRGPCEDPLESEQLAVLESFVPHLTTALSLRRRLSDLEGRATEFENALHQLAAALMLLDVKGNAIFINRAAKLILDANDGLVLTNYGLRSQTPSEDARLHGLIAMAISTRNRKDAIRSGSLLVSRRAKRPLQVLVSPFLSQLAQTTRNAVAIISIADPETKVHLPSEILHEFYGLTQAETRLAGTLLDGISLTEAASLAGVGCETVRSQVKSIFHKTGTRGQAQLVRFLSQLSLRSL